ncbi:MAG: hypothetical protein L3J84_06625 [Gammaproteobacteria bacterium]|nr:hypothetical protein [Gammaproteobacteria bacterium]
MNDYKLSFSLFTFLPLLLLILLAGCSEEDRQALGALSDMAKTLDVIGEAAPSTYNDNCLGPLSDFIDVTTSSDQPSISSAEQSKAVVLLNRCVEELQLEIDLTRKEYPEINELTECKKNLDSMIASKSEQQTKINEFQFLPNNTSQDGSAVASSFLEISLAMITKDSLLAMNRFSVCALEKVAPEQFEPAS